MTSNSNRDGFIRSLINGAKDLPAWARLILIVLVLAGCVFGFVAFGCQGPVPRVRFEMGDKGKAAVPATPDAPTGPSGPTQANVPEKN